MTRAPSAVDAALSDCRAEICAHREIPNSVWGIQIRGVGPVDVVTVGAAVPRKFWRTRLGKALGLEKYTRYGYTSGE